MKHNEPIRSYDFKKSEKIEIELIDLKELSSNPLAFSGSNQAKFYQLVWVSSGELRLDVDFMPINMYAGELFLISINQVYSFKTESECSGKLLIFTNDFFNLSELDNHLLHWATLFNPLFLSPKIQLDNNYVIPFFDLMEAQLKHEKDFYQIHIAQSLLRILLLNMERHLNSETVKKVEHLDLRIGRRFLDAVGKEFRKHHNINYYKEKLGVSEKILAKEVKELTGQTPKEYLDSRIMLEAKRLLSYGKNLSIKEVGGNLGFDEPTNFNKFFKKHSSLTPVQFKENALE